ncbi:hypothetical protein ACEQ8H_008476 [Pleosporales sp. CAS-2024a]
MALQVYLIALSTLVLLAAVRLYQYSKLSTRPVGYPPGPKTRPFLGNLHQIPISHPEFKLADFARQFGGIVGLKFGNQNVVVLSQWKAVWDLVELRGAKYSSRPSIPPADIVAPKGEHPALNVYGDMWRQQRKLLMEFLGREPTEKMKPLQDAESTQMIYDLMHAPELFEKHVNRSFGSVILASVYGKRGETMAPGSSLDTFYTVMERWTNSVGQTSYPPLKSFPFLAAVPDWLTPWQGWKSQALYVRDAQEKVYGGLVKEARADILRGKRSGCFLATVLKTHAKEHFNDKFLFHLTGVLLEGGAETSAASTLIFIMAMAQFPHMLAKAQEEVDRVCGGASRMPSRDDMANLPYITACMLEVLRWRPIAPLGIAHNTTADDSYGSYTIPNDTDVIINVWSINHDESFYDDPHMFDPDRYMRDALGRSPRAMAQDVRHRKINYTFGAGRRVCPGQKFAENSMMMHFAKLVWAFDMKPTGRLPWDHWHGWTEGLVTKPVDLKVKLDLRSDRREAIESARAQADAFWSQFEH